MIQPNDVITENLDMMARQAHMIAWQHGWHDEPERSFGDEVALVHSELSEMIEAFRKGENPYTGRITNDDNYVKYVNSSESNYIPKPEGIVSEAADVIIRILDMAGRYNWNLEDVYKAKMSYNDSRPMRHGGLLM